MKKHFLFLAFGWVFSLLANAQDFELVKDINRNGNDHFGIEVVSSTTAGGLYFAMASDHTVYDTPNLWRSDGTAAGTYPLTDHREFIDYSVDIDRSVLAMGNKVFFISMYEDGTYLFQSDGTKSGTFPVHSALREHESIGRNFGVHNGFVYFADSDLDNYRIWKTDGSSAGATLVRNIPKGKFSSYFPYGFYSSNGKMYFMISNENHENSTLWQTDGTAAGTIPGPLVPSRIKLTGLGGYLYFASQNVLKRTDGINAVTTVSSFSYLDDPMPVGTALYFAAENGSSGIELWRSTGTAAGTGMVKAINPGSESGSVPKELTNVNGTLYFSAETAASGRELWKSNGTAAGTILVKDLNTSGDGAPEKIIAAGTQAAFIADSEYGRMLWKTDGTSAGTIALTDFNVDFPQIVGTTVFFNGMANGKGSQIYKSGLNANSLTQVTAHSGPSSFPHNFFTHNGEIYFQAFQDRTGSELWKTNGTPGGTVFLKDLVPGTAWNSIDNFTSVNNTLYFTVNNKELWKTDGTPAGTVPVKVVGTAANDRIEGMTYVGGTLYFGVTGYPSPLRIWKSDGTSAGTTSFVTFQNMYHFSPVAYNGGLYFGAPDGTGSYDLWKTNGTAAGTTQVKDISSGENNADWLPEYGPAVLNGQLYYFAENAAGTYLVRSDGTAAGTNVVKTMYTDGNSAFASRITKAGNYLYFTAYYDENEPEEVLWRTDGTAAGTIQLGSFESHYDYYQLFRFQRAVEGLFYFVPYDQSAGQRLWVSDGTPAGTHLVKDLGVELEDANDPVFATVGNRVYFSARDQMSGIELWHTDGTASGTYMVQDLTPYASTDFSAMANLDGTLYLGLDIRTVGRELYKFQPKPILPRPTRINSGGPAVIASGRRPFIADAYVRGITQVLAAPTGDIGNTSDDQLYQDQLVGAAFTYNIPVTNGKMSVVLHFSENYWGKPRTIGAGKRKFSVDIENVRKLTEYDIFTAAGGFMKAKTESFVVDVIDGYLTIRFNSGSADKPTVAAIEVIPVADVALSPVADAHVRNTPYATSNYGLESILEIKNGSSASYQRKTYLKFKLSSVSQVSSAKLRIYGSNVQNSSGIAISAFGVADDSWTETGITWSNAPMPSGGSLGTMLVSNAPKYYEIDVTEFVKSQLRADNAASFILTDAAGTNTQVSLHSRENAAFQPQLIIRTTENLMTSVRLAATDLPEQERSDIPSFIYPNPVQDRFQVRISERHAGPVEARLISITGASTSLAGGNALCGGSFLDLDRKKLHLQPGVYLIELSSYSHREVVKVLVAE